MTGRDAVREELAAALCAKEGATIDDLTPESRVALFADLDALLPVVDRIANQRAAAELRAAAEELVKDGRPDLTTVDQVNAVNEAAQVLDDRADELDPT